MRTTWPLSFTAAVFGYCLAVTLSMSIVALLEGWRGMAASIVSLDPDLLHLVLVPAGFHFIAGGIYLLTRPRIGLRQAEWPRITRFALTIGGLVWVGLIALILCIAAAWGAGFPPLIQLFWFLSGPFCFAAGMIAAELLARAASSPEGNHPFDRGASA